MQLGVTFKAFALYFNAVNAFLCWFKLVVLLASTANLHALLFTCLIPSQLSRTTAATPSHTRADVKRFALVTRTFQKASAGIAGFMFVFGVVFYGEPPLLPPQM